MSVKSAWSTRPICVSGFCGVKQLKVLLLHPGWDACLSQGYPPPPALHSLVAIYTLGRRDCESKVPCSRTQHNVPSQGLNPKNECINHDATVPPGLIAFEDRRFVFSQCQLLLSLIVVGFAHPQKLTFSHSNVYYNVVVVCLL